MTDAIYHTVPQTPRPASHPLSPYSPPGVELEEFEFPKDEDYYKSRSRPTRIQTAEWSDERRAKKQLELLRHRFRRNPRLWHMIWPLLLRLLIDVALWAVFLLAILYTTKVEFLNKKEKYIFNAVGVGLPLMLGLNYNSSFKGMASIMRWKILASDKFTLRETDLILSLDSFLAVARLGKLWFRGAINRGETHLLPGRKPRRGIYIGRSLACLAWIVLMLGSQIGVGLLGLTFDFDGKTEILHENGIVTVSNLNAYANGTGNATEDRSTLNEAQYRAHQYGDVAPQTIDVVLVDTVPTDATAHDGAGVIYQLKGTNDWVYRIQDWTIDGGRLLAVPTNRTLTVTTNCAITQDNANVSYTGDLEWVQDIDVLSVPVDAVTYVNFDFDGHQRTYHCGPRCAKIGALSLDSSPDQNVHLINCNVSVSPVSGSSLQPEHLMDDSTALLAAGSVALDGTDRDPFNSSVMLDLSYQFTRYNNRTLWGQDPTDANEFAKRVGRFAVGSIAMLDFYNVNGSSFQIEGEKVKLGNVGVVLKIKSPELWVVIGTLVGTHAFLIPIVLVLASSVRKRPTASLCEYLL
ncbi:hypothetical protein FN846DRAFT_956202 [Sphaerosporella brunnea]|uniref:Uncharacterized protein n=1 Tax=Sphaerosporella brunnea TaxID=1250544 RepID=A0A5J5ESV5_9PEZI|nr:hypothetical protein FN846DRAFT_956202 [Sphaerosporella brunnea]